jgi:hypothetical protein
MGAVKDITWMRTRTGGADSVNFEGLGVELREAAFNNQTSGLKKVT